MDLSSSLEKRPPCPNNIPLLKPLCLIYWEKKVTDISINANSKVILTEDSTWLIFLCIISTFFLLHATLAKFKSFDVCLHSSDCVRGKLSKHQLGVEKSDPVQ